jgi:hypothetical protein
VSALARERTTRCEECDRELARLRSSKRFCGSTCRSRWNRRRPATEDLEHAALLELADLAWAAIRGGADPYLTLSVLLWPPESADEARELVGMAA